MLGLLKRGNVAEGDSKFNRLRDTVFGFLDKLKEAFAVDYLHPFQHATRAPGALLGALPVSIQPWGLPVKVRDGGRHRRERLVTMSGGAKRPIARSTAHACNSNHLSH